MCYQAVGEMVLVARMRRMLVAALVVAAAAVGLSGSAAPAAPAPVVHYVSPTGADTARCTRVAPCLTVQRAYRVARPGSVIELAAGDYPQTSIVRDPSKPRGAAPVTIRPAAGQAARIAGLDFGMPEAKNGPTDVVAERLTIVGRPVAIWESASNIVLRSLSAPNFNVRGARDIRIIGGSYGPCLTDGVTAACSNSKVDVADPPLVSENIVISGVRFHDYRIVPGSGAHFECVFLRGGRNISILNSTFSNCEYFDIFIQQANGQQISNVRIEGNWFEPPFDGQGARRDTVLLLSGVGVPWKDIFIRRNSFIRGLPILDDETGVAWQNVVVEGNILDTLGPCRGDILYRGNMFTKSGCDPSDRTRAFGYLTEAGRLRPHPTEANWVRRVFMEVSAGPTLRAALKRIRKAGAPGPVRTLAGIERLIRDPIYRGKLVGAPGAYPALVTASRSRTAQRVPR
jgi:hypothetical protein